MRGSAPGPFVGSAPRSSSCSDGATSARTLLALGLEPYAGGWRASAPYVTRTQAVLNDPVAALPHYPMVLHRGG